MIKQVTVTGDMVEVQVKVDGEIKEIRRNVQGYELLSEAEKKALWADIVGDPRHEYPKPNFIKSLFKRLTR